ncbi:MAG: hypothetical protein H6818_09310 [Phycisphaerales bacterium]|nr:hypothetical protein [Phycisphaerales bacterium]MCB9864886.1 hypothetical protein [Phycisphaerales bacterium]
MVRDMKQPTALTTASLRFRANAGLMMLMASVSALGGCQWPKEWGGQPEQPKTQYPENIAFNNGNTQEAKVTYVSDSERSDIVQVINLTPTNPWLIFDPLDGKIDGFKTTVYLSATVEGTKDGIKGFFGDGTIIVQMFSDVSEEGARSEMKLAHTWELSPAEAYPWRAKEMSLLGWGYGLRLQWPSELNLSGKKIAILVSYKRTDGRMISSSKPIVRRVPVRGV